MIFIDLGRGVFSQVHGEQVEGLPRWEVMKEVYTVTRVYTVTIHKELANLKS